MECTIFILYKAMPTEGAWESRSSYALITIVWHWLECKNPLLVTQ